MGIGIGIIMFLLVIKFLPKTPQFNSNIDNNPNPNSEETVTSIQNLDMKDASFFCDNSSDNESLIKIKTPRRDKTLFVLKSNDFDKSGWTKAQRCDHIAGKLQTYQNKGTLENVKTGEVDLDGTIYPVICVPDKKEGRCSKEQTLVTLLPDKNANDILAALTKNPESVNICQNYFNYDKSGYLVLNLASFIKTCNQSLSDEL